MKFPIESIAGLYLTAIWNISTTHINVPEFLLAPLYSAKQSVMFSRCLLEKAVIDGYGLPKSHSIPPRLWDTALWIHTPRKALHFRQWRRLPSVMVTQHWPWKRETDTLSDNWHPERKKTPENEDRTKTSPHKNTHFEVLVFTNIVRPKFRIYVYELHLNFPSL